MDRGAREHVFFYRHINNLTGSCLDRPQNSQRVLPDWLPALGDHDVAALRYPDQTRILTAQRFHAEAILILYDQAISDNEQVFFTLAAGFNLDDFAISC